LSYLNHFELFFESFDGIGLFFEALPGLGLAFRQLTDLDLEFRLRLLSGLGRRPVLLLLVLQLALEKDNLFLQRSDLIL